MYTLHPRTNDAGLNVVDVHNADGERLYTTDPTVVPEAAKQQAVAWAEWAENVATGTHESIYYILSVPETWAGPPPGAHPY